MDTLSTLTVLLVALFGLASGHGEAHGGDTIHCWQCDTTLPTMTEAGMECVNGTSLNVTKVDCPLGKCITYTADLSGMATTFVRGCVDAEMDRSGYCDGTNRLLVQGSAKCCTTDYCNGPKMTGSAANLVAGFGIVLISSLALLASVY